MSWGGAPSSGGAGGTWRESRGGLPRRGSGPEAHDVCGEAEGPGLLWPRDMEAQGHTGVACDCLNSVFREDRAFLGRVKQQEKGIKPQSAACEVQTGHKEKETSLKE